MTDLSRIGPPEALRALRKKWDAHHASWLTEQDSPAWPLAFVLHRLRERDVLGSLPATRDWVQAWRTFDLKGGQVEWEERRWPSGNQQLPVRFVVPSAEVAAALLGEEASWFRAKTRYALWCKQFPQLARTKAAGRQCDNVLAGYTEHEFEQLNRLLDWFIANPKSGLYLRQLPVEDIDTKWVEGRRGVVGDLVRELLAADGTGTFHAICGLRAEPSRLRVRVLCPALRAEVGGLCDIEAPTEELARIAIRPRATLIVENLNTGLALPELPGTVAFMRLGLAVDQLEAITWAHDAQRHFYWGDLDTHGFVALARARRRFPCLNSVLMDEGTLQAHRSMWVREPNPSKVAVPEGLTGEELAVYTGLLTNRWGTQVRLEQERIAWGHALRELARI